MKTIWEYTLLVLRFTAGLLFIYSGFLKLVQPIEYFQFAMGMYQIVPENLVPFFSYAIPWLELIAGAFLFLGYLSKPSAAALLVLTVMFQVVIGQAVFRNLPIEECGCFGGLIHFSPCQTYIFDSVVLLVLLALTMSRRNSFSLDSIILEG